MQIITANLLINTLKTLAHQVEKQSLHATYAAAPQAMSDFSLHFQAER